MDTSRKDTIAVYSGIMQFMMSDDDNDLWDKMTEDVTPMQKGRTVKSAHRTKSLPKANATPKNLRANYVPPLSPASIKPVKKQGKDLDRRTEQKLTRGKMSIEGRLDLHGMTQDQAHPALIQFILSAHKHKKRFVLVVTGKGRRNTEDNEYGSGVGIGILKQRVPEWLHMEPLSDIVLKVVDAQPKDGGTGALYIYIRRDRS